MDIKIEERPIGRVTVLDIVGKLTIDQGAQHLKDKINSLLSLSKGEGADAGPRTGVPLTANRR